MVFISSPNTTTQYNLALESHPLFESPEQPKSDGDLKIFRLVDRDVEMQVNEWNKGLTKAGQWGSSTWDVSLAK